MPKRADDLESRWAVIDSESGAVQNRTELAANCSGRPRIRIDCVKTAGTAQSVEHAIKLVDPLNFFTGLKPSDRVGTENCARRITVEREDVVRGEFGGIHQLMGCVRPDRSEHHQTQSQITTDPRNEG